MNRSDFASLGFGVGLRRPHYLQVLDDHPRMDWFEVTSENFMVEGGRPIEVLESVRLRYPIVMHGVSLSIGSTDPLNFAYLRQLATLVRRQPGSPIIYVGPASAAAICTTSCRYHTLRRQYAMLFNAFSRSRNYWNARF
jgi:Protein of unknown function (DUF692)